jgi:uncharacterized membrane protein YbhN (UPF0104 family)
MKKPNKLNTVFFVLGLLLLALMVHKIGINTISDNIVKTGWWFIPVIGSWLIIYGFNALALREIIYEKHLPNTKISFGEILRVTISGYAINYITPVAPLGGEPYRIMQLKDKIGVTKATSSVLLYTIMHMFSHIVFWIVSIPLILLLLPVSTELLIGCSITFLFFALLIVWVVRMYRKGLTVTTFLLLARLPFLKQKMLAFKDKHHQNLTTIDREILELFTVRTKTFYASLLYEFLGRVVGCFEIWFVAIAIGTDMSLLGAFIVSSGSSLFANMLFFFPMQVGTREGGFMLAVKGLGINAYNAVGVYISLVTRIRELIWIAIGLILVKVKTK